MNQARIAKCNGRLLTYQKHLTSNDFILQRDCRTKGSLPIAKLTRIPQLRLIGDATFATEKVYIDNQKLDGFLNGIKKTDCRYLSCDRCGYCEGYSKKAITFSGSDQEEAIRRSNLFLFQMSSSEIF